jgi:hypothetical protein
VRDDVVSDVLSRLKRDYAFKETGEWLRQGKCPACGKRELYAHAESPWAVKCGRLNKCGFETDVKALYPDAFERFNERYKPTSANPNATADAYMSFARGLPIDQIRGWYRQGKFWQANVDRGTATVLFDIDRAADISMERFVESVWETKDNGEKVERKQHFTGKHRGLWWLPPGVTIEEGDTLYLVEACIDAASLNVAGFKAAATLSAGNYPEKALESVPKSVRLIWALDNDPAGRLKIQQHAEKAKAAGFSCGAALIPVRDRRKRDDWNDVYRANRLKADDMDGYLYRGDLLLAENPFEKAFLTWRREARNGFAVEFDNRLYWFSLDLDKFHKELASLKEAGEGEAEARDRAARTAGAITRIANCTFRFLYFQANRLTDESWYYARVDFPTSQKSQKNTFTGAQVAAATEFKKRLLSFAPGALFTGNGKQLDWIIQNYLTNIKVVDTVDFIGYSKEHKTYIFPKIAVSNGRVYELNDEDFFEVGDLSIKTLNQSLALRLGERQEYDPTWIDHLWTSYGAKGLVAVAFFLGSLYAEQIRTIWKSFPFLEIVGQAGAGKSTLIEFLWKLVGRDDYEGIDPNKSTLAARSRIMTQTANLPVALIESDRDDTAKQKQFDWDELKTAFNGRASRARGLKNGGNDTDEAPFRGSILISQNAEVNASEAILSRIVHLHFDTDGHRPEGKEAADALATMPVETVSWFLLNACVRESQALDLMRRQVKQYESEIAATGKVRSFRIMKNHAQMMALVDVLADQLRLPVERVKATKLAIMDAAFERQEAIASDHSIVAQFWEVFDYLDDFGDGINHSNEPDKLIAVNLNHVQQAASERRQELPALTDLKRHLRDSRSRKFVDIKTVKSRIWTNDQNYARTVKCWVFSRDGGKK